MKRVCTLICALLAIGLVRGDANVRHEQDPVVVNAKTIALKLENPRIRVFEATLKPGDKEKPHSHPASVAYVLEGGKFRNYAADGSTNDVELKSGDVFYREPLTHWTENIGDTTIRIVLVELKD